MLYVVTRPADTERLSGLGDLVRRARESLRLSIDNAAARAPMSAVTWMRVERGQSVRGLTYAGIESALNWERGAVERYLLHGEDPTTAGAVQVEPDADEPLDEGERIIMSAPVPEAVRARMLARYRGRVEEARIRMEEARLRALAETQEDLRWEQERQRNVG